MFLLHYLQPSDFFLAPTHVLLAIAIAIFLVCNRIVNIWNSLPSDTTDFSSFLKFRRSVSYEYLVSHCKALKAVRSAPYRCFCLLTFFLRVGWFVDCRKSGKRLQHDWRVYSVNLRSCLLRHDDGTRWPWSLPLSHQVPTPLWPAGLRRTPSIRAVPGRPRLPGVLDGRHRVCARPVCLRNGSYCHLVPHLPLSTSRRPLRGIIDNAIYFWQCFLYYNNCLRTDFTAWRKQRMS